ncbi:DUF4438 domain-containing protein [Candidatus Bathyarchaeota archaeon]|nr:DUF4438 domain-containing protein [Candidatus Bathyarchaeota archaeon]
MLKTNKNHLIMSAVQGIIQPLSGMGWGVKWDGSPRISLGTASINYSVSVGDLVYGHANADHVEPDVTIQGRDKPSASDCALAVLACIGNEAKVITGDAKGKKGIYIGRHAGADDLVWFPPDVIEDLGVEDKIQIKTWGVGLKIHGFEDIKLNKMSPILLEAMNIQEEDGKLVVPVARELPGYILGAGIGYDPSIESVDYDIQTTCPETNNELDLGTLRLGDVIAINDHYDAWGRGRYEGATTIGVIVHGWSDGGGHGPGVNPIMAALPGKIKIKLDPKANIAYYLGIKKD